MIQRAEREDAKLQRLSHELTPEQELLFRRFAGRQFWCNSVIEANPKRKCFQHLVGLPEKNGRLHPLYSYQTEIIDHLMDKGRYVAIKKARGLGFSTLFVRWMAWLALCKNDTYRNKRFLIVVGPREALAVNLIHKLKTLVMKFGIVEETDRTLCRFLNVEVEAFPSSRVDTMRSFDNVAAIYVDEAAFFPSATEAESVRSVSEGYIAKCSPWIIMVSTPSIPGVMFENVMDEPDNTCLYKRYRLSHEVGLNKIFTQEEIDAAKLSPNFEREYNLAFSHGLGNAFLEQDIKKSIVDYAMPTSTELLNTVVNVGVDLGFSSSKHAIVVTAALPSASVGSGTSEDKVYVLYASEFPKLSFQVAVELTANVLRQYGFSTYTHNVICLLDGSRPEFAGALKTEMNEDPNYQGQLEYATKYRIPIDSLMAIIPVNFGGKDGRQLLSHMQSLLSDGALAIAPRFTDLLLQLRQARTRTTNNMLDKSGASLDLVDAASLSLFNIQRRLT